MKQRIPSGQAAEDPRDLQPAPAQRQGVPAASGGDTPLQRQAADTFHDSPRQVAQRRICDSLHDSPRQVAQRQEHPAVLQQRAPGPVATSARASNGLPDTLRANMEAMSGVGLDDVRVHRNSAQPAQLNALAYAQGSDIHLGPGQEAHLPHEAWHVVQQRQGRVRPTLQRFGTDINDDAALESEATAMGERALRQGGPGHAPVQRQAMGGAGGGPEVVQRQLTGGDVGELEFFYLREIRAIGSPFHRTHQQVYRQALAADDLPAAKEIIRAHVRDWFKELDEGAIDWREPGEEEAITGSDLNRLGVPKPPVVPQNRKTLDRLDYTAVKGKSRKEKLTTIASVSEPFKMTPYEESKRRNTDALEESGVLRRIDQLAQIVRASPAFAEQIAADPHLSMGGQIGVYYRYHKFGQTDRSGLVFGGFFNKSDIDSDVPPSAERGTLLHTKAMSTYFKDREKSLGVLGEKDDSPQGRARKATTLEKAQASAQHTPFIATTSTRGYGEQLLGEYPPSKGQYAVMLTILGPAVNTLDFESEFRALKAGPPENNYRINPNRAKDKAQSEFGIPDVFIPIGERSPLGFVIAHVERLSK